MRTVLLTRQVSRAGAPRPSWILWRKPAVQRPLPPVQRPPVVSDFSNPIVSKPVKPVRKAKTSTERVQAMRARRLVAGRCADCGKRRRKFGHRCVDCQRRQRIYHRAHYRPNFATMPPTAREQRRRNRKRLAAFLAKLAAEE
jgi:hypothetical protein